MPPTSPVLPPRRFLPLLVFLLVLLATFASAEETKNPSISQAIDTEIRTAWKREKRTPSRRADDAAFLRRIYLDLVGTIPTTAEAEAFLKDTDARKRAKLIDKLLADPRFATQQANVWDLVFFGRNPPNGESVRRREPFKKWLSEQFAKNVSYDKWVRDLLLSEQEGTGYFFAQHRNQPEEATVAVSRIFLGTQLQCARCHDHPYERWTQRDFFGMAGFFVRLVVVEKTAGKEKAFTIGEKSTGDVLFTGAVKDRKPGQKGEPIKPRFLGSEKELVEPALPAGFKDIDTRSGTPKTPLPKPFFSRKEKLVGWLTDAKNPWFARAAVNRVWEQYLSRGFVHPVDDLTEKNTPSHPELFEMLTKRFVEQKFDLKWLIRELVNSETYQLASAGPSREASPPWFEQGRVRPLSAEELLASIRTATGADAGSISQNGTNEYFLRYFGEPKNGRGEFQGSLSEHLFLNNSTNLRQMITRRKGNLADTILTLPGGWEKRVDHLFLAVLSRPPSKLERDRFIEYLSAPATATTKPDNLAEEAIWVLLNTAEFRFNH